MVDFLNKIRLRLGRLYFSGGNRPRLGVLLSLTNVLRFPDSARAGALPLRRRQISGFFYSRIGVLMDSLNFSGGMLWEM